MTTTTSHKRKRNPVDFNTIKRFKELHFHILDDHHDPQEHFNQDLNRYFTSPTILPVTHNAQEAIVVDVTLDYGNDDDDEVEDMDVVTQKDDEQELSQQMNDLSMEQKNKKMKVIHTFDPNDMNYDRIVDIEEEIGDQVPMYLSDDNDQLKQRMKKILQNQSLLSSISVEDLRQMAIFKHQIGICDQQKRLLLVYLRSVRGNIKRTMDRFISY